MSHELVLHSLHSSDAQSAAIIAPPGRDKLSKYTKNRLQHLDAHWKTLLPAIENDDAYADWRLTFDEATAASAPLPTADSSTSSGKMERVFADWLGWVDQFKLVERPEPVEGQALDLTSFYAKHCADARRRVGKSKVELNFCAVVYGLCRLSDDHTWTDAGHLAEDKRALYLALSLSPVAMLAKRDISSIDVYSGPNIELVSGARTAYAYSLSL